MINKNAHSLRLFELRRDRELTFPARLSTRTASNWKLSRKLRRIHLNSIIDMSQFIIKTQKTEK